MTSAAKGWSANRKTDPYYAISKTDCDGKFVIPDWAEEPKWKDALFEVYKEEGVMINYVRLGNSKSRVFGRNAEICQEVMVHPSISRMHAAIVHASDGPLIVDLFSSHGTFVNGEKLPPGQPVVLFDRDLVTFGCSTRIHRLKLGQGAPSAPPPFEKKTKDSASSKVPQQDSKAQDQSEQKKSQQDLKPKTETGVKDESTLREKVESDKKQEVEQERPSNKRRLQSSESEKRGDERASKSHHHHTHPSHSRDMQDKKGDEKISCRHILVKHSKSRNPHSWRQKETITRSLEEALLMIEGFRDQIVSKKASFEEIASKYSDCKSHESGGSLGFFERGQMQKAFEDAAFALTIGELSEPVKSDSGVHIILREA